MGLQLYDLAGADPQHRFSPYCWRSKLALAHKGLKIETIPWRFTDKDVIAFSGQQRVPILVDDGLCVSDSWRIAVYLESAYPNGPSLFGGLSAMAAARFINAWADGLNAMLAPVLARDILVHLHDKDRGYFRESREKRFGLTIEAAAADRASKLVAFRQNLEPLRTVLAGQRYLGGDALLYTDYIVFGTFQWARCVGEFRLLLENDPVAAWCERLLQAFDGLAIRA